MTDNKIVGTKIQFPLMDIPKNPTIGFGSSLSKYLASTFIKHNKVLSNEKTTRIYY